MKKLLICFSVLCMSLLLFCGSALAAESTVTAANAYKGIVTVANGSTEGTYTVSRTQDVERGQLYLVLILKGDVVEKPVPQKDDVYYMDVQEAGADGITFSKVFPKEMEKGTYSVYLSDYKTASGAAKGVATIKVSDGGATTIVYGDINGDGEVKANDRIMLARYVAELPGWYGPEAVASRGIHLENADLNRDGAIKSNDRIILARYVAELPGWTTLPR